MPPVALRFLRPRKWDSMPWDHKRCWIRCVSVQTIVWVTSPVSKGACANLTIRSVPSGVCQNGQQYEGTPG